MSFNKVTTNKHLRGYHAVSIVYLYSRHKVCGVDLSNPHQPVCISAVQDGHKLVVQPVKGVPEGSLAACALPSTACLIRRLQSPFSSSSKTKRVLPSLLDVQMPFSLEDCFVSFTHLGRGADGKIEAVAAAARKTSLNTCLEQARSRGIDPAFIDAEGIALWDGALAEKGFPESNTAMAVVRLDTDSSTLDLGTGARILSAHPLSALDVRHIKRLIIAAFGTHARLLSYLSGA